MNFDYEHYGRLLCAGDEKQRNVQRIQRLINSAEAWHQRHTQFPHSIKHVQHDLQIYKDESIVTAYTFITLHKCGLTAVDQLIGNAFPGLGFSANRIYLEYPVSPPTQTLVEAHQQALNHPVKYVREVTNQSPMKPREGATRFDVVVHGTENGSQEETAVFFECKFTSDISTSVDYGDCRNQLARCIDVGLADRKNDVSKFAFVLLTPKRYKGTGTRFYQYKFDEYKRYPESLASDIPRLRQWSYDELNHVASRLAWITWEDCAKVVLQSPNLPALLLKDFVHVYGERLFTA